MAAAPAGANRRRFPRASERIPVRLVLEDGRRQFEATVYSTDVSLSGIFCASTFYLKPGTVLGLEFKMPNDDRVVRTRAMVVREVRVEDGSGKGARSGFGLRFIEYLADAKAVLASSFLIAELDAFLDDYLRRRSTEPRNELDALREVIIAWEVGKMELKGGELDIMRDRITVDSEGRIRRRQAGEGGRGKAGTRTKGEAKAKASPPARRRRAPAKASR